MQAGKLAESVAKYSALAETPELRCAADPETKFIDEVGRLRGEVRKLFKQASLETDKLGPIELELLTSADDTFTAAGKIKIAGIEQEGVDFVQAS